MSTHLFDRFMSRYIIALGKQPSQGKLRGCASLLLGNVLQFIHKFQIFVEILFRETWGYFPEIFFPKIVAGFDLSRQESTAEGGVGDCCDAKLATCF